MWFVRILLWFQAFAAPVLLFGLIAFLFCRKSENYTLAIIIMVAGAVAGIVAAEYIRRKWGLESFFGRIYGPNDMDERKPEEPKK